METYSKGSRYIMEKRAQSKMVLLTVCSASKSGDGEVWFGYSPWKLEKLFFFFYMEGQGTGSVTPGLEHPHIEQITCSLLLHDGCTM